MGDSPVLTLEQRVQTFIDEAREKAKDGLSFADFGSLAFALLKTVALGLDDLNVPGKVKKKDVEIAIGMLFDAVADQCVPVLARWTVWPFVKPVARSLIIAILSGVLDRSLPDVRAST